MMVVEAMMMHKNNLTCDRGGCPAGWSVLIEFEDGELQLCGHDYDQFEAELGSYDVIVMDTRLDETEQEQDDDKVPAGA